MLGIALVFCVFPTTGLNMCYVMACLSAYPLAWEILGSPCSVGSTGFLFLFLAFKVPFLTESSLLAFLSRGPGELGSTIGATQLPWASSPWCRAGPPPGSRERGGRCSTAGGTGQGTGRTWTPEVVGAHWLIQQCCNQPPCRGPSILWTLPAPLGSAHWKANHSPC